MNDSLRTLADPSIYWRLPTPLHSWAWGVWCTAPPCLGSETNRASWRGKGSIARSPTCASVTFPLLRSPPTSGRPSSAPSQGPPRSRDTQRHTLALSALGLPERLSGVCMHQNHPQGLLKPRFLGPTSRVSDPEAWGPGGCISNKFPRWC